MQQRLGKWFWPLKILLSTAVLGFVAYKLHSLAYSFSSFHSLTGISNILCVLSALLLLPLNLGLEAKKWQLAIRGKASYAESVAGVFAGCTLGIITPNRLGDYLGRSMSLAKHHQAEGAVATFFSRICQLPPLVLGVVFALPALYNTQPQLQRFYWIVTALFATTLLFVWFAFQLPSHLRRIVRPVPWLQKKLKQLLSTKLSSPPTLRFKMLLLSTVRYCVFVLQFALVMKACGAAQPILLLLAAAALIFGIKALIPSLALAELGIRETVSILVAGWLLLPSAALFNASLLLFAINLLLPAVVGLSFMPKKVPIAAT